MQGREKVGGLAGGDYRRKDGTRQAKNFKPAWGSMEILI